MSDRLYYRVRKPGLTIGQPYDIGDVIALTPEQAQYYLAPYPVALEEIGPASTITEDITEFRRSWLGSRAADPMVDATGQAVRPGASYYNTTSDTVRALRADGWHGEEEEAAAAIAAAAAADDARTRAAQAQQTATAAAGQATAANTAAQAAATAAELAASTAENALEERLEKALNLADLASVEEARRNLRIADFDTRADLAAATLPAPQMVFRVGGHTAAGDGGHGRYRRVTVADPWQFQSADGAYLQYVPEGDRIAAMAFGAVATATPAARTAAWNAAVDFAGVIVGDQAGQEDEGFYITVHGSGRPHLLASPILLDDDSHRGIIVSSAKLIADGVAAWGAPMISISANARVTVRDVHFDGREVAEALLKQGAGSNCVFSGNVVRHFRNYGIKVEQGAATWIVGNDVAQYVTVDTGYIDAARRTGRGIWLCAPDLKVMLNRSFGSGTTLQLGDAALGLNGGTSLFVGNHTWNDTPSGTMVRGLKQIVILAGSSGNIFSGHYIGNGTIDLYDHRQTFMSNIWMGTNYPDEARFRLFAEVVGQDYVNGLYIDVFPNASTSVAGVSVDVTTDGTDVLVLSAADVDKCAVRNGISGAGIPTGAKVTEIISATTIRISAATTASATVAAKVRRPLIELYGNGANTWAVGSVDDALRFPQHLRLVDRGGHMWMTNSNVDEPIYIFGRFGSTYPATIGFKNGATTKAPEIGAEGDVLVLKTNGTVATRVDASGRMLRGPTTALATVLSGSAVTPVNQTAGTNSDGASHLVARYSANAAGPTLFLAKSRGAAVGTHAGLNGGDTLGAVWFGGSDGAAFLEAASVQVKADASPTTGVIKGRMLFNIANASGSPTEAWRMSSILDLRPGADATQDFGNASYRINNSYFAVAPTVGSDARLKDVRGALSDAELRAWARVQPAVYRLLAAVTEKGDAARLHVGLVAQEVEAAFAAEDLDARRYALFCEDAMVEPVAVERVVQRPRIERVTVTRQVPVVEADRVVMTTVTEEVDQVMRRRLPLVDEAGAPMRDRDGKELTHEIEITDDVTVIEYDERPVLEADGSPVTRLSLRYEQCLVMEAAYQRSRVAALEARLAALEA